MTQPVDSIVSQWAVSATVRAAGPRLLSVHVAYAAVPVAVVETGPGELELRAHWTAPPELAADSEALGRLATSTTFARGGQLRCTAGGGAIDVAYPLVLEGLTRNAFYDAATEVAKAAVTIDESVRSSRPEPAAADERDVPEPVAIDEPDDLVEAAAPLAQPHGAPEPIAEAVPEPFVEPEPVTEQQPLTQQQPVIEPEPQRGIEPEIQPMGSAQSQVPAVTDERPVIESPPTVPTPVMYSPPTQSPGAQREPDASTQRPEQADPVRPAEPVREPEPMLQHEPATVQQSPGPVVSQAPAWMPTHTVPPGGVPAWAAPDPAQPPVTQLPPGLPVRLVERRGGWARIEADNGWSGWVDGRPLPDPPAN